MKFTIEITKKLRILPNKAAIWRKFYKNRLNRPFLYILAVLRKLAR